jgi:regulation of enolase protein 1 (concanavalin A-like superfamily)
MGRIQYEVIPHGDAWRVRTSGFGHDYPTQLEAMFEALYQAKAMWKTLHAPTAVMVRMADGHWREARTFGEDTLDL